MSQQSPALSAHERPSEIARAVEQVYRIALQGLPPVLVADAAAIWGAGGEAGGENERAGAIVEKLRLLAAQNALRIIVRDPTPQQAEMLQQAIVREHLALEWRHPEETAPRHLPELVRAAPTSIAVLATADSAIPDGCTAFHVGADDAPPRTHATQPRGTQATDALLALYGTALMQERAGIAFRAISQGNGIPQEAPAAPESLAGVVHAVSWSEAHPAGSRRALPDETALQALAGRAYQRLLPNLLPNGAVVGSPAQGKEPGQPNYWFYWQRDGSVTMGHLIAWQRQPPPGLPAADHHDQIGRYRDFVARTQRQGDLGTSRYTVEGDPITGFGNPQLDGPPLSAMTLARMEPSAEVWGLMRGYLDYLLTPEGSGLGMDAWEFVYGQHFNAAFLKHRALLIGAAAATRQGHGEEAQRYADAAQQMASTLAAFIDPRLGRLRAFTATANPWCSQMSGLDTAILCALLSGRDLVARGTPGATRQTGQAGLGPDLGALTHPAVLATITALEDAFAARFAVNRQWIANGNAGFGLGRFPEDANDGVSTGGGNPWPLATLWAAQCYYHIAREMAQALEESEGDALALDDPRQAAFVARATGHAFSPAQPIAAALWREDIMPSLLARGDGYLNFVVQHLPEDGGVTEQIDGETGAPRGARDLSWALSELIATLALREAIRNSL